MVRWGEYIRSMFEQEVKGLPAREPLYRVLHTTKKTFGKVLKMHKNILVVQQGDSHAYISKRDKYAHPQQYQSVTSITSKGLLEILKKKTGKNR